MAQLIDKDALLAEIERIKNEYYCDIHDEYDGFVRNALDKVLSSIHTLEVKEVEKEIPTWVREVPIDQFNDMWFIGMDGFLHRRGYKIKICDLWNLPKEQFNSKKIDTL